MTRYSCERCGDCGQGLTWIEIAFGRFADPVCGACLQKRIPTIDLDAMTLEECEAADRDISGE